MKTLTAYLFLFVVLAVVGLAASADRAEKSGELAGTASVWSTTAR